jgi:uncharacterized protein (DUF1499 family)
MRFLLIIPAILLTAMILLSLLSQRGSAKGLVDGKLAPLPDKPNGVRSEIGTQPDKVVAPFQTDQASLLAAIKEMGGEVTSTSDDYISAIYTSRFMRFVDDVEFRRDGDVWHVRSASRVGYSDMGANKKRVAALRATLG